jgi:hypothetical protein
LAIEYFLAYHSYIDAMTPLSDEESGRLFRACLVYSKTGSITELSGNERYVFPSIKSQIDRDNEKYQKRCDKNRQNVLQRYTTVYDCIPSNMNATKEKEKEKENNTPPKRDRKSVL